MVIGEHVCLIDANWRIHDLPHGELILSQGETAKRTHRGHRRQSLGRKRRAARAPGASPPVLFDGDQLRDAAGAQDVWTGVCGHNRACRMQIR